MRRTVTPYALAAAALVLALVLLVLGTAPPTQNDDPSSRVAGKAGTLALYTWLGDLGFNVHRISGQFGTSATDALFIVDPRSPISDADAGAVMQALAHGADLVLAVPAQPIDAGGRVHSVPMGAGSAIDPAPFLTPLLAQGGALTAVAEQVPGGGRAYVLASAFPLSNDGLRDGDSSTLVLSMLERARGGAIGFDEVHHGEVNANLGGAEAVFESPLGLALLLGVAAVVAFLALSGRRLGRPLPAGDAALVPTTASYIDAMAGLYARSRDRGAVASRYAEELKQRLAPGPAGDPGLGGDEAFITALAASRPELTANAAAVLGRARALAAAAPDAAALLELARDVDDLERRWAEPAPVAPAQWRA
jgi:hypothetical protein